MPDFYEITDENGKLIGFKTPYTGRRLLSIPQLNKGRAFSAEERSLFDLNGILPYSYTSLIDQVSFYYKQFNKLSTSLEKNYFLNRLKQHNITVFYRLAMDHIKEVLPILYTPTIGDAVKQFSYQFDVPQGIFISYADRKQLDNVFNQVVLHHVDLIIITDGEGVLGIGDWGIGGMDICVGKLIVYTLCGKINPNRVLPIQIDVGTNNKELIHDEFYKGWKKPRITKEEYDVFIQEIIDKIQDRFPNVFLHWEDFGRSNANRFLKKYRNSLCTFNDDIQGTGATASACVLSWLNVTKMLPDKIKLIMFGAGTAGIGIVDHLVQTLIQMGMTKECATRSIWLIDQQGVLFKDTEGLTPAQIQYARPTNERVLFSSTRELASIVKTSQANAIIGCSTVKGAFNEPVVLELCNNTSRPLIMPLSNPTSRSEAIPSDLVDWSSGNAIIATGSPFDPVPYEDRLIEIAQCNNAYVFPGLGLGVIASKATRVSENMISAACHALAECSPCLNHVNAPLLPDFNQIQKVSEVIATSVARAAIEEGYSTMNVEDLEKEIEAVIWSPEYLPIYQKK